MGAVSPAFNNFRNWNPSLGIHRQVPFHCFVAQSFAYEAVAYEYQAVERNVEKSKPCSRAKRKECGRNNRYRSKGIDFVSSRAARLQAVLGKFGMLTASSNET